MKEALESVQEDSSLKPRQITQSKGNKWLTGRHQSLNTTRNINPIEPSGRITQTRDMRFNYTQRGSGLSLVSQDPY